MGRVSIQKDGNLLNEEYILKHFPKEWEILGTFTEDISFIVEDNRLKLETGIDNYKPLFIDIEKELLYHHKFFQKHSIYKELFAKSLGIKKNELRPCVFDATGGMLGDTLLMVAMGCKVIVSERHPIISSLIINALENQSSLDNDQIIFCFGDGIKTASKIDCDVIFFDPMYAVKNKKASPKKSMQVFRELVGVDEDAHETAIKLKAMEKRLVIKRSIKAPPLIENPSIIFNGKSTSYDVYL